MQVGGWMLCLCGLYHFKELELEAIPEYIPESIGTCPIVSCLYCNPVEHKLWKWSRSWFEANLKHKHFYKEKKSPFSWDVDMLYKNCFFFSEKMEHNQDPQVQRMVNLTHEIVCCLITQTWWKPFLLDMKTCFGEGAKQSFQYKLFYWDLHGDLVEGNIFLALCTQKYSSQLSW